MFYNFQLLISNLYFPISIFETNEIQKGLVETIYVTWKSSLIEVTPFCETAIKIHSITDTYILLRSIRIQHSKQQIQLKFKIDLILY